VKYTLLIEDDESNTKWWYTSISFETVDDVFDELYDLTLDESVRKFVAKKFGLSDAD
jgi:hypothetical protein